MMGSSYRHEIASTIYVLLMSFFLFSPVFVVKSSENFWQEKETSMSGNGSKKMKLINAHLRKINKPLSSRLSPNGDIIDCVLFHHQPAFDLPELRGTMPMDPPKLPKGHDNRIIRSEMKQLWSSNGDSCPNGAIPIRRTSASDMLRSHSISKYGKKLTSAKNNSSGQRHEHALGYLWGREHYGIKAILNVWAPNVTNKDDFSLSQIWVISDIPNHDVNVIEAGWTDLKSGNWLLSLDDNQIGYWQSALFPSLGDHATMIQFGGEVFDSQASGRRHTSTQMGSGHFPTEGFGKASFIKNIELVDGQDTIIPALADIIVAAEKPNCYDVTSGYNGLWGSYIFFGGPGNNPNCP